MRTPTTKTFTVALGTLPSGVVPGDPSAVATTIRDSGDTPPSAIGTIPPLGIEYGAEAATAVDPSGLEAFQTIGVIVCAGTARTAVGETLSALARSRIAGARMMLRRRMSAGRDASARLNLRGLQIPLGREAACGRLREMATAWLLASSRKCPV